METVLQQFCKAEKAAGKPSPETATLRPQTVRFSLLVLRVIVLDLVCEEGEFSIGETPISASLPLQRFRSKMTEDSQQQCEDELKRVFSQEDFRWVFLVLVVANPLTSIG